jgi:hypothetical protein
MVSVFFTILSKLVSVWIGTSMVPVWYRSDFIWKSECLTTGGLKSWGTTRAGRDRSRAERNFGGQKRGAERTRWLAVGWRWDQKGWLSGGDEQGLPRLPSHLEEGESGRRKQSEIENEPNGFVFLHFYLITVIRLGVFWSVH